MRKRLRASEYLSRVSLAFGFAAVVIGVGLYACDTVIAQVHHSYPYGNPWLITGCLFCMLVGVALLTLGLVSALYALQTRSRSTIGHCQKCGCNLTGNVSGQCPECGEAT